MEKAGPLSLTRGKQERAGASVGYGTGFHGNFYRPVEIVFGVPVLPARDRVEFQSALDRAFSMGGPVIVEAFIDGSEYGEFIASS